MKKIETFLQNTYWRNGVEVHMRQMINGEDHFAKPVEFVQIPDNRDVQPAFMLTRDDAQHLMDELWNCGFRPTEGAGSAGQLAATQRHLEDFRTLAFHALKVDATKGDKKP